MSNVIGYKGTPLERKIKWLTLRILKENYRTLKMDPNETLRQIALEDLDKYYIFLCSYISAEPASAD